MTCKYLVTLALLISLLPACTKEPGVGGKSTLTGKVYVVEYSNNTGTPTGDEYYAPEHRVFIRYGNNPFHDDDVRTGPDGLYKFDWLRKGSYTVFAYGECPTCESGQIAVFKTVEIGSNNEVVEVNDIVVENWVN